MSGQICTCMLTTGRSPEWGQAPPNHFGGGNEEKSLVHINYPVWSQ